MSEERCLCGGVILADTEDWETPLCYSCFIDTVKKVKDYKKLESKLSIAVEALEKISDPRKRDHREPDAYTELGCVMHIARTAPRENIRRG